MNLQMKRARGTLRIDLEAVGLHHQVKSERITTEERAKTASLRSGIPA